MGRGATREIRPLCHAGDAFQRFFRSAFLSCALAAARQLEAQRPPVRATRAARAPPAEVERAVPLPVVAPSTVAAACRAAAVLARTRAAAALTRRQAVAVEELSALVEPVGSQASPVLRMFQPRAAHAHWQWEDAPGEQRRFWRAARPALVQRPDGRSPHHPHTAHPRLQVVPLFARRRPLVATRPSCVCQATPRPVGARRATA